METVHRCAAAGSVDCVAKLRFIENRKEAETPAGKRYLVSFQNENFKLWSWNAEHGVGTDGM